MSLDLISWEAIDNTWQLSRTLHMANKKLLSKLHLHYPCNLTKHTAAMVTMNFVGSLSLQSPMWAKGTVLSLSV